MVMQTAKLTPPLQDMEEDETDAGEGGSQRMAFEYVILDEAGAMLEPDAIGTLIHGARALLLVTAQALCGEQHPSSAIRIPSHSTHALLPSAPLQHPSTFTGRHLASCTTPSPPRTLSTQLRGILVLPPIGS